MGDRRNIIITEEVGQPGVAIYTHWGGSSAPAMLAEALDLPQARNRYDDTGYLTRIIFDSLTERDHGSETGYGLYPSVDGVSSPMEHSPGYDIIVESLHKRVRIGTTVYTFEEFIAAKDMADTLS